MFYGVGKLNKVRHTRLRLDLRQLSPFMQRTAQISYSGHPSQENIAHTNSIKIYLQKLPEINLRKRKF
jgi:hypothetical protein